MKHDDICIRIRLAIIGCSACLTLFYAMMIFFTVSMFGFRQSVFWLLFETLKTAPCFVAAVCGWRVSLLVKADRSFSSDTAKALNKISTCAMVEALVFVAAELAEFAFLSGFVSRIGFAIIIKTVVSFIMIVMSLAAGAAFAAIARFVQKAADLKEESDYTV